MAFALVGAACAPSGTSPTTTYAPVDPTVAASSTTSTTGPAPSLETTGVTTTTTAAPTIVVDESAATFTYAVVAEKQARRLAVIDPTGRCLDEKDICDLPQITAVDLPDRPHNITSVGMVVYATHPDAGTISRVDIASSDVLTVRVGAEPHDVKYDAGAGLLIVADEEGRRLLFVDPLTLGIVDVMDLPAKPHDLTIDSGVIWVTMIGSGDLARIINGAIEFLPTGGLPHDLIVDADGLVWFSNWGSDRLSIFDPVAGITPEAPAGVGEPQHFAIAPDGVVWISDIAGDAVVGFTSGQPTTVEVGESPHHVAFAGDTLVVAVSGTGQAVFVRAGAVVGRSRLTVGLHGVAIIESGSPLSP
jgi:hypothetical protein